MFSVLGTISPIFFAAVLIRSVTGFGRGATSLVREATLVVGLDDLIVCEGKDRVFFPVALFR
jgi:hypothetical protein